MHQFLDCIAVSRVSEQFILMACEGKREYCAYMKKSRGDNQADEEKHK
jgi:hypothetical protein